MKLQDVQQRFTEIYGSGGDIASFHAPGRVNVIGEHTDYNGGYVFPCALSFGTIGVARKRDDSVIRLASTNFEQRAETTLKKLEYDEKHGWANYLKGVICEFQKRGNTLGGLDILIDGSIPNGAGLSSSASIELLTAVILNDFFNCQMSMPDMVKLSQKAENQYIGVNCGIMDQFAVGMGKKDHAIFLHCDTLDYEHVPFVLDGCKLVIANTNYRRGLTDSKYNERRAECDRAVAFLQKGMDIRLLGQLSIEDFEENKHLIQDETVLKRAEHVVYEDSRVLEAVQKLRAGDIVSFGELMNRSHQSLRDLYEVTGDALDALVEEAWNVEGVVGSRMTGAGFGGCTVSIVRDGAVEELIRTVGERYRKRIGLEAAFYIAEVGDGAKKL